MNELPPEMKTRVPGPRGAALARRLGELECPAFGARRDARASVSGADQAPIVYARGDGVNVWDADGNRYVDLTAGFGALLFGHSDPRVARAAHHQIDDLVLALGDVYSAEFKIELCGALSQLFPEPNARVMLGLSGADAITAALKTAVLHTGRAGVVAFEGSYHGLSYAPLAACGFDASFREPFAAQLGDHVRFAPYGEIPELDETIGAVIVEPILGRGGCVVPAEGFLEGLRAACDRAGALLIADEIWTFARCGARFASSVTPDLLCLGKGLGGGFPISACVGKDDVMQSWSRFGAVHTATHFGWPVACTTALAVLEALDSILPLAWDPLDVFRERGVAARGRGLMIGLPLPSAADALRVSRALLERGYIVLTGGADGATITLTPPLEISSATLERFADVFAELR